MLVFLLVGAHAWVAGSVPSQGVCEKQTIYISLIGLLLYAGHDFNAAGVLVVLLNPHNNFTKCILLCFFINE